MDDSQAIQAALQTANQRLDKSLDALDKSDILINALTENAKAKDAVIFAQEETKKAKDETIKAQDESLKAKDSALSAKDVQIASRDEQIAALARIKCDKSSFLFIFRKTRCR